MPCGEKLMSHRPVDGRDTASRRRITIAEMHTPPRCGWGSSDRRWRAGWSSTRSTAMDYGGDADRHEVGRRRVNGAMWLPAEFTFVVGAHALRRVTHTHRYIRRWRGGRDVRADGGPATSWCLTTTTSKVTMVICHLNDASTWQPRHTGQLRSLASHLTLTMALAFIVTAV